MTGETKAKTPRKSKAALADDRWQLRLYVAGQTPKSKRLSATSPTPNGCWWGWTSNHLGEAVLEF
jgi:hypothetical protein